MLYQKPICDCGEELIYEVDKVITNVQYKIKKNGQLFENPIKWTTTMAKHGENYNWGRFSCLECGNNYEFNMEIKTRKTLRGELL